MREGGALSRLAERRPGARPRGAEPPGGPEHHLVGLPKRDLAVTGLFVVATAALFVLMANHATRAPIQRLDGAFERRMVAIRLTGNRRPAISWGRQKK